MNIQTLRSKFVNVKREVAAIWHNLKKEKMAAEHDQNHVMTEEEMLDEELKESFPASDPPGHFSKSAEDAKIH